MAPCIFLWIFILYELGGFALKKVLYVGWIGYQNLGDELMFDLFKQQFLKLDGSYKLESANIEHQFLKNVSFKEYDLIVLGGGSILSREPYFVHPYTVDILHQALSLNKKIMIWGTGIDWVPKSYIQQLENHEEIPLVVSDDFKLKTREVFEESAWVGVRGPLTSKVLQNFGVKNIQVSGDPGFLLTNRNLDGDQVPPFHHHEKVIGVNWGTTYNFIYGQNEIEVENQLARALNQLIDQGYKVYLFIVWNADLEAAERLYSKLHNKQSAILDKTLYNQEELMNIIQHFAFTINFKLHANYLSLASHVPFIALGYRFKVFDFIKSVDLEDYIISTDQDDITEQILHLEPKIMKDQTAIISKMKMFQSLYSKRIRVPFENHLYL